MHFKYLFFCIFIFYNAEAKLREVVCPDYCSCDVFRNFKRAVCQSKKLVSAEIGIPPEVELFDLSYNQISELGNRVFADDGLTELKLLNLSNNKISQIHMFAFEGIKNLKSLDLSFNILEYFLDQWFSNWQNLEELYLQGNNLVLINKQPTLNLPSLKILDLSQSKIEYFNPNIFTLLPKLEILDISSNYMQRLNVEVIVPLTNLQLLVAKDNNLECKDKFVPSLRQLIRKKSITYVGPCIRRVRRMKTRRPNIEGSSPIPNKPDNSEYIVKDENNKDLVSAAPAGYTAFPNKTGKSEKSLLKEDLDKTTDVLAKYGTNGNYDVLEKNDKTPNSGKVEDKTNNDLALPEMNQDGAIVEKFDKVQNTGIVEGVNKPNNTDTLEISSNLVTVSDSEILGDLENFINSDQFQKMKMESPSPNNKLGNSALFNNDDKLEISENNKPEKIKDDDLFNDLKNFLQFEKLSKVSISDSKAEPVSETSTNAPKTIEVKPSVSVLAEKNAWMVDDEKIDIDSDKSKNYVENCNGTKKVNFKNALDKMAMEIIEISPSLILIIFTLFGIMLGLVLGCSLDIKEIPKLKKPGRKCLDLFKRRNPKNKKPDKNETGQSEIKIPIQDDEVKTKEDNEEQSAPYDHGEKDDCDVCEEEEEMLRQREDHKKPAKSSFEDQSLLLDNELLPDDTTPMLGKKEFSSTED